jgi:hypothetical protein
MHSHRLANRSERQVVLPIRATGRGCCSDFRRFIHADAVHEGCNSSMSGSIDGVTVGHEHKTSERQM